MATWLRKYDGAVCPRTGVRITQFRRAGDVEWSVSPCEQGERCEHLSRAFAGPHNASVQCRCQGVQ